MKFSTDCYALNNEEINQLLHDFIDSLYKVINIDQVSQNKLIIKLECKGYQSPEDLSSEQDLSESMDLSQSIETERSLPKKSFFVWDLTKNKTQSESEELSEESTRSYSM